MNPGATEVEGDGVDNDCDEGTLDGPDAEPPSLWWSETRPEIANGDEVPTGYSEIWAEVGASDNVGVVRVVFTNESGAWDWDATDDDEPWTTYFQLGPPTPGLENRLEATAYDEEGNYSTISMTITWP